MATTDPTKPPPYNDGSLRRKGARYGCGCVVGYYDCYDALLCCGRNPANADKIARHRRELRSGPNSSRLDFDAFMAREGDGVRRHEGCSCHISPPCSWCIEHCPDCGDHVDDCDCGTCQE